MAAVRYVAVNRCRRGCRRGLRADRAGGHREAAADIGLDGQPEACYQHARHAQRESADDRAVLAFHRRRGAGGGRLVTVEPYVRRQSQLQPVLCNGGTLYIDDGRPVAHLIERTVENLRDIGPTLHFNVPRGFDALAPFLEADDAFAARFFGRLQMLFYAAASLPPSLRERFERVAARHREAPVFFASAWGSTETSPVVTSVH